MISSFFSNIQEQDCFVTEPDVANVGCTINPYLNSTRSYFLSFSIEGEYVPVEGDEVTYKVSRVPPKNLKVQAVEVKITHLNPGTKHETWSGQILSS